MFASIVNCIGLVQIGMKTRVLRDMKTRQIFQRTEALRRAYLFVARNVTLPDAIRMRAQHRLAQLPKRSTPNIVKNTCIKTGKQRGVLQDFKTSRIQLRFDVLRNNAPGVKKAMW